MAEQQTKERVTPAQVLTIRALWNKGMTARQIAEEMKWVILPSTVYNYVFACKQGDKNG